MAEHTPPTPLPRLLLAAPMSGSGKTTLSAGLIAALRRRGLNIAPFKVGPDYIDPGYLGLAAGRSCHNLDAWMLSPDTIRPLLTRHSRQADLALIEGVMGLFDGYAGDDDSGSSAQIARLTETPVLLVLDVRAQARTAAALVLGLRDFDPRLPIAGVLLNRVGSAKHAQMVSRAIEEHVGLPVLGALQRSDDLHLPERHLGLVPTAEPGRWQEWLDDAAEQISTTVDLDRLLELAGAAPPLDGAPDWTPLVAKTTAAPRIAFAQDAAFSFRYEDNLALLRQAGAELLPFSPLSDRELPPGTQAIYLCGGFPELYAGELAANDSLQAQIRQAAAAGLPIYAECGGLMYLTETLIDGEGRSYPMAGVLPGQSRMTSRLTMGYRTVEAHAAHWLLRPGETLRGHEFHYSSWDRSEAQILPAYRVLPDAWQRQPRPDGAVIGKVLASYIHLHFLAFPELAQRFVQAAAQQ